MSSTQHDGIETGDEQRIVRFTAAIPAPFERLVSEPPANRGEGTSGTFFPDRGPSAKAARDWLPI